MRLLTVEDVVIDKKFSELSMVPHDSYLVYAIAAAHGYYNAEGHCTDHQHRIHSPHNRCV